MPHSPSPLSLASYEAILAQHRAAALAIERTIAGCSQGRFDWLRGPAERLLEQAQQGERVAAKLIEAWYRDARERAECRAAVERAVCKRFSGDRSD